MLKEIINKFKNRFLLNKSEIFLINYFSKKKKKIF